MLKSKLFLIGAMLAVSMSASAHANTSLDIVTLTPTASPAVYAVALENVGQVPASFVADQFLVSTEQTALIAPVSTTAYLRETASQPVADASLTVSGVPSPGLNDANEHEPGAAEQPLHGRQLT